MSSVTFIVPVYNNAKTIGETLDSIMAQTSKIDLSVVVVDDQSTDTTRTIVREWLALHDTELEHREIKATLIEQAHAGEAVAINRGLKIADSEFVAWVEGDVKLHPEWILHLLTAMDDDTVVGVGGVLYPAEDDSLIAKMFGYEITVKQLKQQGYSNHITSANALYRRWIFGRIGDCKAHLGHSSFDSDVNERIRQQGFHLAINQNAKAWHHFKDRLSDCLVRSFHYGYRRPFIQTQVLYSFDRIQSVFVLASLLTYVVLVLLMVDPWLALWTFGVMVGFHWFYSIILFCVIRAWTLLLSFPVFYLRNFVFINAFALGLVAKFWDSRSKQS